MQTKLNENGIYLNSYTHGTYKTFCPKCKNTRKSHNTHDMPLSVTIENDKALFKCHNCENTGIVSDKQMYQTVSKSNPEKLNGWFSKRGISQKTTEDLGIYEWNDNICFPYIQEGEVKNVKYRTYDKRFRQKPNAQRTLYNIDNVKKYWDLTGNKNLIICEGEMDVVAFYESGVINAVSLPDGAPKSAKFDLKDLRFSALKNCSFLSQVDKVYLACDQDDAGRALHLELVHRFGKDRCLTIKFPKLKDGTYIKDANECLLKLGRNTLIQCLKDAIPYPIQGIYTIKNYTKEVFDIYEGKIQRPLSTGFKLLDQIYKIQAGTFHLVTGVPNHGKSNFIDQLAVNLLREHQWKFCVFSPEHSTPQHIRRIVEKIVKKPFDDGVVPKMSASELERGLNVLNENFYFMENKDEIPTIEWILDKAKQAVLKFGVKGIIIDPYNEINSTREGNKREDEHIRDIISKAKKFCRTHEVVIWMVAHPSKMPRSEDGSIQVPTLYDVSGSAHWNNMCDAGIVIARNFDTQQTRLITRKIREQGVYGNIGECFFNYDLSERVYKEVVESKPIEDNQQRWYND